MPPASAEGAPKGGAVIFATQHIQKSVNSVEAGMGMEG